MNLNEVAVEVAKREGKKEQVNIAQIKEVIKHLASIVYEKTSIDLSALLKKVK